jgi:hypothetical protein
MFIGRGPDIPAMLGTIIGTPIGGIISLFIVGAIFYVISKALGGTGSYEGTVRFMSYASAPLVLASIPLIGLIAGIYGLYLYVVGGMNVHNVSMGKSLLAVLLPTILIILLIVVIAGLAVLYSVVS